METRNTLYFDQCNYSRAGPIVSCHTCWTDPHVNTLCSPIPVIDQPELQTPIMLDLCAPIMLHLARTNELQYSAPPLSRAGEVKNVRLGV